LEVAREALEREQAPVFDPRGLIGYEGRLEAEIRVLSLPPGHDPDDLIGSDPARWVALVEGSAPVIEFIFQRLLGQIDRDDAKDRSRVVKRMLPLLRDVADPVERESYAQKIARELGLRETTLLSQLYAAEQRAASSQQQSLGTESAGPGVTDLERYLISILLCRPTLLEMVDEALVEMGLVPLRPQDLQDAANRSVFEIWQGMEPRSLEDVRESVPQPVEEQLESLLEEREMADEQLVREAVRAGLRLRKQALKQRGLALQMLMEDSDWDQVAEGMGETVKENARALLQVEQALARR
jgi:DNA primase